jgi:hypothetical protein
MNKYLGRYTQSVFSSGSVKLPLFGPALDHGEFSFNVIPAKLGSKGTSRGKDLTTAIVVSQRDLFLHYHQRCEVLCTIGNSKNEAYVAL